MFRAILIPEIRFLFSICPFKNFIKLITVMILSALFETFSIFVVYFFIVTLANPSSIHASKTLNYIYDIFLFNSLEGFIIFFGLFVFICLILMNLFNAFNVLLINRFGYQKSNELETKIFKYYLKKPYSFYLNRNTNELTKNILVESNRVISGILVNGLQCISRKIVLISIIFTLLIVEPLITSLISITFVLIYVLIFYFIKLKLSHAGKMSSDSATKRYKTIHETFNTIKELFILKKTDKYIKEFSKNSFIYAKSEALIQMTPSMVKNFLEIAAFGSILVISFITLLKHQNSSEVLPIIGLYAFSGYRLLPAAQQIFSGYALARFHWPALKTLTQEFSTERVNFKENSEAEENDINVNFNDAIQIKNVYYRYPNTNKDSLININLNIKKNNIIGIFGQTGSGKTTLLDVVLGLLIPNKGEFFLDGIKVNSGLINIFNKVGYVSQNIRLIDDSVINNIAFGCVASEINVEMVLRSAKLAQIHDFIEAELPEKYDTIVGENGIRLSGGQKQRIVIARALYQNPEILILDEATSALDCMTESAITESLNHVGLQKTIIIVSHRLKTLENCDIIYFLHKGKIVDFGTYEHLKNNILFNKVSGIMTDIINNEL